LAPASARKRRLDRTDRRVPGQDSILSGRLVRFVMSEAPRAVHRHRRKNPRPCPVLEVTKPVWTRSPYLAEGAGL